MVLKSPPFAKGDLGGFLTGMKSPLYKGGNLRQQVSLNMEMTWKKQQRQTAHGEIRPSTAISRELRQSRITALSGSRIQASGFAGGT
jgi:hypothetical protein